MLLTSPNPTLHLPQNLVQGHVTCWSTVVHSPKTMHRPTHTCHPASRWIHRRGRPPVVGSTRDRNARHLRIWWSATATQPGRAPSLSLLRATLPTVATARVPQEGQVWFALWKWTLGSLESVLSGKSGGNSWTGSLAEWLPPPPKFIQNALSHRFILVVALQRTAESNHPQDSLSRRERKRKQRRRLSLAPVGLALLFVPFWHPSRPINIAGSSPPPDRRTAKSVSLAYVIKSVGRRCCTRQVTCAPLAKEKPENPGVQVQLAKTKQAARAEHKCLTLCEKICKFRKTKVKVKTVYKWHIEYN